MSFTKLFQRTSMPFDNGWQSTLSPLTERTRIAPLFGDTPLITDILNRNVTKNVDIHGRGAWGIGKDDATSFKEKGDEFMINERIFDALKRINNNKENKKEKWIVITMDGKLLEFPDYSTAQTRLREDKIPYKFIMRKVAQKHYYDYMNVALGASFEIQSYDTTTKIREVGATFAIGNGEFMTCAHCIKKYDKNQMPNPNEIDQSIIISLVKNDKIFSAKLKKIDFHIDVAIVESDMESDILEFVSPKDVLIGTRVFTVGSPSGFENNVTEGILSSKNRSVFNYAGAPKYLFTDAHVLPGNSGGALISEMDGKVIGMMALIVSGMGYYGLNAAIPSEYLVEFREF